MGQGRFGPDRILSGVIMCHVVGNNGVFLERGSRGPCVGFLGPGSIWQRMRYFCAKFLWIKGVFYHGLCVIIYAGRIVPCLHWYLIRVIGRMTSLEWFSIFEVRTKNGKDWNPAIPLVKRIFLVPGHNWPKTIKGQPALTHVIRNYVLLLVVPPLCLWWVTHIVMKALRLKILPRQQLPLPPPPPPPPYWLVT